MSDFLPKNWYYFLRIYGDNSAKSWEKTLLYKVDSLAQASHTFCEVNEQLDPDLISAFGTSTPSPAHYLLHLSPGWDENIIDPPIILVHGAGLDATSYVNLYNMHYKGIKQQLVALGYKVFSITFAHSHGDNFHQAEILAHAIEKVKELTQAEKVNIIAHSKGGFAARIYLSNLALTPYRNDVHQYIMLGTPNLGTDYVFRYPGISYLIYLAGGNGVIAWDKVMHLGNLIDISPRAIYSDGSFPGQSQMLYPWDEFYPLDITQQDWWTTYYGGTGFMSSSRGIKKAIADGGNLVQKLETKGLHPDIYCSILAGDRGILNVFPSPSSNPSDGIVLVDSVLNTYGICKEGAKIKKKTILPLNHMELLYDFRVAPWIHGQLSD
ncbi:MAG TPA: hypothetical protein VFD02_06600 [Syntrophomonadaceae bacterium]|nr:hypothetical protein [Syntrophomonadaceae bacterium]